MIPYRVRLAVLLALVFHGAFILTAFYRLSYDAYTHMFFADHYLHNWWSLWDPRWYAGFNVVFYPPLVHQLIAAFGSVLGVDAGYGLVSWIVLAAYPIGVYVFSRVFVDQKPAEFAALGAAVLPSIYLASYTFGQLPSLTATLLTLFFTAALAEYLRTRSLLSAALAVMLVAVVLGAHHATLLLIPWLVIAVGLHLLIFSQVSWKTILPRLALISLAAGFMGLLVIWPFWRLGLSQSMQTPIDHLSRHNFLTDLRAGGIFFLAVYGPFVLLIPMALRKILDRRFFALSSLFLFLFLLGLGGTTPLPRWLFGGNWEWLTYDRFAFWATLTLLPFFGNFLSTPRAAPQIRTDFALPFRQSKEWSQTFWYLRSHLARNRFYLISFGSLAVVSVVVTILPALLITQPRPVDMQPIVQYLTQNSNPQWRYLTFGFGDQFAYLNRLTQATTIDGSYHTARTLPELRSSGIGQIDSVYWLAPNLKPLDPILKAAGRYGVRWGFVDNPEYIPALIRNAWVFKTVLSDGIQVWENPTAVLPTPTPAPVDNPLESFSWGTLPILALAVTTGLAGLRVRPGFTLQALSAIYRLAIGLLPIGLVFWYFRPLTQFSAPRVYFTYNNALFFLSDALALIALLAWILATWFHTTNMPIGEIIQKPVLRIQWSNSVMPWIFALCCLASLSVLWSNDWRVSLYLCLHLWLGFGLFCSLRSQPAALRSAMLGFCFALGLQVAFGLAEFTLQSTHLLSPLHLMWPGELEPSIRGASVVQQVEGTRWLRVYGSLPHPNILGTMTVVLLSGPAFFFLLNQKAHRWAVVLFFWGVVLLILTFSRGAWLGFLASALVIAFKSRFLVRKRLFWLGSAGTVGLAVVVFLLQSLFVSRIAGTESVSTEAFSLLGRDWLASQAVSVIQKSPLLGIGMGSFILQLAQHAAYGYIIEPVHSLPLLMVSELGIGGAVILIGMVIVIGRKIWHTRHPKTILMSAGLVGLCVTSLFDHSLWTLAPGRILLALVLGLWAGQAAYEIKPTPR